MKKALLLFLSFFITSNVHAYTLDLTEYISNADVTIANLQSDNNTLETWGNGGIEGGTNIKSGSLVSKDFADSVSLIIERNETFNDWTYSGMLPATSTDLTSDISAGISRVDGIRISNTAQSHTYTASKDTYVYIHSGGYYVYSEVANGAAAPSTPSNTLLLAKVVTDTDNITSVTDSRTTSVSISASSSTFPAHYKHGSGVGRDSTTQVHLEPGSLAIGTTIYSNASDTTAISDATAANWIEGSVPNKTNLQFWVYAYNSSGSALDIKFCSSDPAYSDISENTGGTLLYYKSGTTYYRVLAYISADSSGNIQEVTHNLVEPRIIQQSVYETGALQTTTVQTVSDDTIPTSSEGEEFMRCTIHPRNASNKLIVEVEFQYALSNAVDGMIGSIFQDAGASAITSAFGVYTMSGDTLNVKAIVVAGTTNPTTFKFRAGPIVAGTLAMNGITTGPARRLGGVLISRMTITEVGA